MNSRKLTRWLVLGLSAVLVLALLVPPAAAEKKGGILKVVIDADPPTIDPHASSTTLVFVVGYHMFEGLLALDASMKPVPMLAADLPQLSADKKVYTFTLRSGLKFHNGQPVTADDVVASIVRWGAMSNYGKAIFKNVETVRALDAGTIEMRMTQPTGTVLVSLAMPNGGAFIYPKALCEKYPGKAMSEFVGTGPFQFIEWQPNRHIRLKRFDGYQPLETPATGFGGKKTAWVDELWFVPISDEAVRLNSVEGGEYDFADFVPVDEYDRLKEDPNIQTLPSKPRAWFAFNFNKRAGIMSRVKMRQAFLAALDMGPVMAAGYGNDAFWRLDPSLMLREQAWASDAGGQYYNQANPERARQLLEEAGYQGEKIVWMSGPLEYNLSLAAKNQLEKAGFVIDLQAMEWATLSDRRKNPELWDIYSTGMTLKADPTMFTAFNPKYAGWWEHPKLIELLALMATETDFDKRYDMLEAIQTLFYEDVPTIKVADYANLRIAANSVKGFQNLNEIFFWNVWKE